MRKLIVSILMLLAFAATAVGQPGRPGAVPPPARFNVSFESQHGETFTVFLDGDQVNSMPQSRVMVNDIGDQTHEVVVILKRPAAKAAVLQLRPGEPNVTVNVNYDMRQEQLYLYTPAYNRPDGDAERRYRREVRFDDVAADIVPLPRDHELRQATDDDVDRMVLQLKGQSFDKIDFSNSQVEFLKYAYQYCSDPRGYSVAVEILTFASDKKKVTDYIATQR